MAYWQLFYHIVTATKNRRLIITEEYELELYNYILDKAGDLETRVLAINGTHDHIHIVASIPPKLAVATFIGQVKGYSSGQFNKRHPNMPPFAWQDDYGVFSFDSKRLRPCIEYVKDQKDHHRLGRIIAALEIGEEPRSRIAEPSASYQADAIDLLLKEYPPEFPW